MADLANALGPPAPPKTAVISSDLSMMFYGFLIIGVSVLLLSIYHFIILKLYSLNHHNRLLHYHQQHMPQPSSRGNNQSGGGTESSSGNVGNALNSISIEGNLGGKKEVKLIKHDPRKSNNGGYCGYGNDCAVCLSVFEEGEVVQQLPRCNHCFHADCIDLWLYSHLDCPLCRTPVRLQIATSSDSDDDNRNCNQSSRIQLPQVSNELP